MLTGCVVAYVGVRSGSTRVPSKNSRPFTYDRASGEALSLLDLKLRTLARVPSVDAVVVSSDSEEMLAVAARYAHVTPLRRDPYYASSTVPVAEFFRHMAHEVHAFNATTVGGNDVSYDCLLGRERSLCPRSASAASGRSGSSRGAAPFARS